MKKTMLLRFVWLMLCCGLLVGRVQSAPILLAEQADQPGSLLIPYRLYRLDNGLTLILHPDHSDPLVHVNVSYHVGSNREVQGLTGFAHFFEHMMFQGSKHVADQQHFKLIEQAGGSVNGTTGQDMTRYYETVPANELEKVLWLEADRMGFLLDAVSQHKFEIQRATVKNEKAQRFDNQPYGRLGEVLGESLYPRNHPYSWQPIGYVDDLDRVDVNDLKRFFLRWYGPNNATLVIGGDFDSRQVLAWVEKYFGPIPRGPEVSRPAPQPTRLPADRYVTFEDAIRQPALLISIPTRVQGGSMDEAALDIFSQLLAGSKSSRLYQQLVKPGLALQVSADFNCRELDCVLNLTVLPNPEKLHSLKPLADAVRRTLLNFGEGGIAEADLQRIRGGLKADGVWARESVEAKVSQLAAGQVIWQDPNANQHFLQRVGRVTTTQILAAWREQIRRQPALYLSVVPKGQAHWQVAKPNYQPAPRVPSAHQSEPIPALRPVSDQFDRSQIPATGPALTAKVPAIWRQTLPSSIEVLGSRQQEIPAVSLTLALPGGSRVESPSLVGLANLTAMMVRQGSTRLSGEQFNEALDRLGSTISVSSGNYYTLIQVSSLTEHLPATLALVDEMLNHPGLRESDFIRLKNQLLQARAQAEQRPENRADEAFYRLIYGPNSPLSAPDEGALTTLSRLTLDDVKHFYQQYYFPAGGKLVVVGDVTPEELLPQLAFLQARPGQAMSLPSLKPTEPEAQPGIYLVDQPGAVQSTLRIGRRSMPFDTTGDFLLARLANFNFGGTFNSRLNLRLREELGLTYGARSSFQANQDTGALVLSSNVRADGTATALTETLSLLKQYAAAGPTETELAYLKTAFSQQDALAYETLGQKAGFLLDLAVRGDQPDYVTRQQQTVQAVSQAALQYQAARWFAPEKLIMVVVGDAASLEKSLATLHLPITRYSLPSSRPMTDRPQGQ